MEIAGVKMRSSPTYQKTLEYLYALRGQEGQVRSYELRLDRVGWALTLLGSPHQQYPTLHVGGTNGKGSCAAILHAILSAAGYRVGLYTSPHLIDFRERIRVGHREISPPELLELVEGVRSCLGREGVELTFFEMTTVLAFTYFSLFRVDVAVIEVGLGGRLDATNVIGPEVAVITSVGLDHEEYLGSTAASVAREKGGIIKENIPAVVGAVGPEARRVLECQARERGSPVYFFGQDFSIHVGERGLFDYCGLHWVGRQLSLHLPGRFQRRNAAAALMALELVRERFPVSHPAIEWGLREVRWPGRLETVSSSPLVILDGAHNPQAVDALSEELSPLLQGRKSTLFFGVMSDKKWVPMAEKLARLVSAVVVTPIQQPRSADPARLRDTFARYVPTRIVTNARESLGLLLTEVGKDEAIIVTGSLFLVGEVYPLFLLRQDRTTLFADTVEPGCFPR